MGQIDNKKTSAAVLSVGSNSLLIILKIVVGLLIGSVSVLSEAIHSGVDLVAAVIALFAVRASGQQADERHPFGHGKVENISGHDRGAAHLRGRRLDHLRGGPEAHPPEPIDMPVWGVGVMLVSAVVNTFVSRQLFKVGKETDSVALQADAWHLRTDVYTSVGVMVGLLVSGRRDHLAGRQPALARPGGGHPRGADDHQGGLGPDPESARDLLDVSLPDEDVDGSRTSSLQAWPDGAQLPPPADAQGRLPPLRRLPSGGRRHHVGGRGPYPGDEIVVAIKRRLPESRVHIHVEPCDFSAHESCVSG